MENIIQKFNLAVEKMRGRDEFEIYKNYVNDLPLASIPTFLHIYFGTALDQKSDSKALHAREQGNGQFRLKNYVKSLWLYTRSLRYANYNDKEYAVALANRSAVYFEMEDYKSSIDDINLCLQANYPNHLKPKVYIRKAKCYQKLGEASDMRKTLFDLLNYLDDNAGIIKLANIDEYKKVVKELITASAESKPEPEDKFDVLPPISSNPKFLNASSSITLKFTKRRGCHVVAKKEIKRGDVLFVEEAYTFAPFPFDSVSKEYIPIYCQYCLSSISNSVPCKNCVKHLYCNEKCRDAAWKEFHQWECIAVQARFFRMCPEGHLALRICLKAVLTGISTNTINFENGIVSYGNKDNNYPYVYNLPSYIQKMKKNELMEYAAFAALLIHYLRMKTKFFEWMNQLPAYANKTDKDLMNKIGGLILRHCTQLHRSTVVMHAIENQRRPNMMPIAITVCPSVTMMSHSCIPNTAFYFVGNSVVVKAIDNIKIDEEVCRTFGGSSWMLLDKEVRQALLQKVYNFNCICRICSDPRMDTSDLYICINCNGPAKVVNTPLYPQCACLDCNSTFMLPIQYAIGERMAGESLARFAILGNLDDANKCCAISRSIFRPDHSIFEDLYLNLLKYYKFKGEAECFIKISNMLVEYAERKYSNLAVDIGLLCYCICLDCIDILNVTAPNMNINQLKEILEELTKFIEKAKVVFTLQCPQFGTRLQKVEKSVSELRILHTSNR